MKYHIDQEKQLLEDVLSFAYDPLGFVEYVYPWRVKGTPLERFELKTWQRECLADIRDHVKEQQNIMDMDLWDLLRVFQELIASGRGTGKSALFGMLSNWMTSTHPGASVVVTANTESQLRTKTFPEFGRWFTMALNSHWWEPEAMAVRPAGWLASLVRDQLGIDTKYWSIVGQNWSEENPDAFAGVHNSYGLAVFFDEASGIPEPIWTVTRGFFTEQTAFRLWMGFSQGRRNNGAFYERFHSPVHKDYWRTRHLDARTVEGTDKSVYEEIINVYGPGSDQARVEVYGQFPEQGEGQLIPTSVVREAQQRDIGFSEDNDEPLILGIDPAPRGRTVLRFRQGRDAKSIPRRVLNGKDNTEIVDTVVELVNKYDPDAIVVDAGNGTGVIDELRKRRGIHVYEVWFGSSSSSSTGEWALTGGELWAKMANWLPGGSIDDAQELFDDLTRRTWEWFGGREDNKKTLTSKRAMEKEGIPSPDDADALCLTFYPSLPRRNSRTRRGRGGAARMAAGVGECRF